MNRENIVDRILKRIRPTFCFQNKKIIAALSKIKGDVAVLGIGKAASLQLEALTQLLEHNRDITLVSAACLSKRGHIKSLKAMYPFILELEGNHPIPGEKTFESSELILNWCKSLDSKTTLITCISGGTSSLFEFSKEGISNEETIRLYTELLVSGKPIEAINKIRISNSNVKGGKLLSFIKSATVLNLITSDIPTGDLSLVGSGPTIGKETTEYILSDFDYLLKEIKQLIPNLEYEAHPLNCNLEQAVELEIEWLRNSMDSAHETYEEELMHFTGGEILVEVNGTGKGGRNTHYVAEMALRIFKENVLNLSEKELLKIKILSFGTDGTDGNTTCAGAWIDYQNYLKNTDIEKHLKDFNTYEYFSTLGTLIETGATGNNIMDVRLSSIKISDEGK